MKKVCFFIFLTIQSSQFLFSRELNDTVLIEKTGWLVYWHDKIIWVEAAIKGNVKDRLFFKAAKEYVNGLNVNSSPTAIVFKSIAKGHSISYFHNDSIIKETDPAYLDSIWILPVKVKYKVGFEAALETMTLSFIKNNHEIFIKYKGVADYSIREIELIRKKDKRKLKRVTSYEVYPPH